MASPLEVLGFHKKVFKFFGMFQIETESKKLKQLMEIYIVGYQVVFTDLGFLLFSLAVLESDSSKELLQILFVVFAYLNAVVKALIFYLKRKHLERLWSTFDDPEYTARDHTEYEWEQTNVWQYKKTIMILWNNLEYDTTGLLTPLNFKLPNLSTFIRASVL